MSASSGSPETSFPDEVESGVRQSLQLDGYDLRIVAMDAPRATFEVFVTASACSECLVPKGVMAALLQAGYAKSGQELTEIELLYPSDSSQHG